MAGLAAIEALAEGRVLRMSAACVARACGASSAGAASAVTVAVASLLGGRAVCAARTHADAEALLFEELLRGARGAAIRLWMSYGGG